MEQENNEQNQETKEKGLIFVHIAMLSVLVSATLSFIGLLMMIF